MKCKNCGENIEPSGIKEYDVGVFRHINSRMLLCLKRDKNDKFELWATPFTFNDYYLQINEMC